MGLHSTLFDITGWGRFFNVDNRRSPAILVIQSIVEWHGRYGRAIVVTKLRMLKVKKRKVEGLGQGQKLGKKLGNGKTR
jgi:hypothetical protein